MIVFAGKSLCSKRENNEGYVFLFARSPDAPITMIARGLLLWVKSLLLQVLFVDSEFIILHLFTYYLLLMK